MRLQEVGYEPPAQPEGKSCAVRWLCVYALLRESNPPRRRRRGRRQALWYHSSVFIDGEGRLSSCGSAQEGEEDDEDDAVDLPGLLGHGEGVLRLNTPTRLPSTLGGERAVSVLVGDSHSLALTADGAVWSWGDGGYGQLGHGDQQEQQLPKKIEALAGRRVVAVSAGYFHSLATTADGAVWSWGDGDDGQLGHGDEQHQLLPKEVEAFAGQRVAAVSAGGSHSLAITADGAVWSWGFGAFGKLGHGDLQDQLLPKTVEAFAGQRVIAVSAGCDHNLAITADSAVWSWGCGGNGRLGHGDRQRQPLPKKVEAFAGQRVAAVSAGDDHSLAITADGAVWSWGNGGFGKLGHGDLQGQLLPKKVEALAGQRVVAVSSGREHGLALTADGAVWSWGYGGSGQLGHGDQQEQLLPTKVEAFAGQRVVALSAGQYHSIAIIADGAVFTWGEGEYRCLGHGEDLSDQLLPKRVEAWAQ